MSCKYAIFNDEGRYDCKISDDECIYLIPNKNKCIKDGYLDSNVIDGTMHQLLKPNKK